MRRAPAPTRSRPVRCARPQRTSWSRRIWGSPRTVTARTCCSRSASATRIPAGWRRNWRVGWVARCAILALPASRIDARSPSSGSRYPRRRVRWRTLRGLRIRNLRCSRCIVTAASCRAAPWRVTASPSAFATTQVLASSCRSAASRSGVSGCPTTSARSASGARPAISSPRWPRSPPGRPDGFVLSAARSLIFNAVLGERVRQGSWGTLAPGDVANLDGRGSVFAVAELTPDLPQRLAQLEVHPTGPMWGVGELMSRGSGAGVGAAHRRAARRGLPVS